MRKDIKYLAYSAAVFLIMSSKAQAATVAANISAAASAYYGDDFDVTCGVIGNCIQHTRSYNTSSTPSISGSYGETASTHAISASGFASYTLDAGLGVLKMAAQATSTPDTPGISLTTSMVSLSVKIRETFTAIGTGLATFTASLDGVVSATQRSLQDQSAVASFYANMTYANPVGYGAQSYEVEEVTIPFSDMLTTSVWLEAGEEFEVEWEFLLGASNFAHSNLLNTVYLGVSTDQNLTLVAGDTNFLSGKSAAVPVPAALLLLTAGLGFLGLFGWRRKNAVA